MTFIDIPLDLGGIDRNSKDAEIIGLVQESRRKTAALMEEEHRMEALAQTVEGLRLMRDFSDFGNREFRALLVSQIFDMAQIHFELRDYKQSEKELEVLFRILEVLMKEDQERFGKYHILAMELSTRILRSRKKTLEMLVKQQMNAGSLYDKVNAGVNAATDKLVDSLRNVGELLASTGDYRAAMKFYTEAIRLSKKRAGRVTRKEVKLTVEMAKIMMRVRSMRPRARRLLNAVLPHAIALETIELEEDILALIHIIDLDDEHEPAWRAFMHKVQKSAAAAYRKVVKSEEQQMKDEVEGIEQDVAVQIAEQDVAGAAGKNAGKKDKKKKKDKKEE